MNLPKVFFKRFCLYNNSWLLNIKIFRTTFYERTSQQLKAAKLSTNQESKNGNRKQKKQQKTQQQHIKSSKPTHFPPNPPIFLMDFLHVVYVFQCLKTCFARIIQVIVITSFVICHLFLKAIAFLELLVAIYFSIPFALLISEMRLLI